MGSCRTLAYSAAALLLGLGAPAAAQVLDAADADTVANQQNTMDLLESGLSLLERAQQLGHCTDFATVDEFYFSTLRSLKGNLLSDRWLDDFVRRYDAVKARGCTLRAGSNAPASPRSETAGSLVGTWNRRGDNPSRTWRMEEEGGEMRFLPLFTTPDRENTSVGTREGNIIHISYPPGGAYDCGDGVVWDLPNSARFVVATGGVSITYQALDFSIDEDCFVTTGDWKDVGIYDRVIENDGPAPESILEDIDQSATLTGVWRTHLYGETQYWQVEEEGAQFRLFRYSHTAPNITNTTRGTRQGDIIMVSIPPIVRYQCPGESQSRVLADAFRFTVSTDGDTLVSATRSFTLAENCQPVLGDWSPLTRYERVTDPDEPIRQ